MKFRHILLTLLLALGLVACGSGQESTESQTEASSEEATEAASEESQDQETEAESEEEASEEETEETTSDSSGEKVVIYSNSFDEEKTAWLEEKTAEAGLEFELVSAGGGEIFQRLMAEKEDIQAHVVIGMDEGSFSQLQENDMLIEWNPEWKSQIDSELIQGDGYYYPWAEQRIFAFYDANQMEEADAPTSLEELANEKYDQMYDVPNSLGGSTNQKIVFSILLQHLDENGELGVSDEGWQIVEDYFTYGYMPAESEDKHALLGDGVTQMSYFFSGGIPDREEEYGYSAVPINPDYGVFTMSEQVGIMNRGDDVNYAAATEFAEWWGSVETQKGWIEEFGTVPANSEALDVVNPRTLELFEQTDRMDVDWDTLNENLDDWVEKIELEYMY